MCQHVMPNPTVFKAEVLLNLERSNGGSGLECQSWFPVLPMLFSEVKVRSAEMIPQSNYF